MKRIFKFKTLLFFVLIFTVVNCKSTYNIYNNIYELKVKNDNYEFVWKGYVMKAADSNIEHPQWFKVHLPNDIKDFRGDYDSFVFKYPKGQMVLISESYSTLAADETNVFEFTDINTIDELKKILRSYSQYENLKRFKLKKDRSSFIYSDEISKIICLNIEDESVDNFKTTLASFEYIEKKPN